MAAGQVKKQRHFALFIVGKLIILLLVLPANFDKLAFRPNPMDALKKIKNALVSVYHKEGIEPLARELDSLGVSIYATGGTQALIESFGIKVHTVEGLTGYPSILGGRVKTLHPKVFGGILARREMKEDIAQLAQFSIPEIDLVVVDLYPFEETLSAGASGQDVIEKIDIGGISLIRAAAKNFHDVLIVASRDRYDFLRHLLTEKNGASSLSDREKLAAHAFSVSSHYDTAIFNYFNRGEEKVFKKSIVSHHVMRYGENPHQQGVFYGDFDALFKKHSGKEISYNNILDTDAAVALIADFNEPTFAILKHNNACGLASRPRIADAWKAALAGDPVSAFGGVLIANAPIDMESAGEINKLFFEILIAPAFDEASLELLKSKKNRILLEQKKFTLPPVQFRSVLNGVLEQDRDMKTESRSDMKTVTARAPSAAGMEDLVFANKIVKHSKSNAIVLAKDKQLLASGVGQTSRVDALKQAIAKAKSFNFDLRGAVMASDAFFPFPDCVEIASEAGIEAVVQPGGSLKDNESIACCDSRSMAMVFTGNRHFKH